VAGILSALLLGPLAHAAREELVVFYDTSYSTRYGGDPEPALLYFKAHGFKHLDTQGLLAWVERTIADGRAPRSAVVQLSDVTPTPLVLPWDETSALYRYCHAGGRFVAPAGSTLYGFEDEKGLAVRNQGAETPGERRYLTKVFGVNFVYGLAGKGRKLTAAGEAWGLGSDPAWLRSLITGVPPEDVTVSLAQSEDDVCALAWLKTVNPAHPSSGLVGMVTALPAFEPLLEAIHRVCLYDGQSVLQAPKVDWQPSTAPPAVGIRLGLRAGVFPRRAYQRGEEVSLGVEVSGPEYRGEAVEVVLTLGPEAVWRRSYPAGARPGLSVREGVPTADLRCGEYRLSARVDDRPPTEESLWICPARRQNPFPFMVFKDRRENPRREQIALDFVRDLNANVWMHDLHRIEGALANVKVAASWGDSLDRCLRSNLIVNGHPDALAIYAKQGEEPTVLANGEALTYGVYQGLSWRSFADAHLPEYRTQLRRQLTLLREFGSPAVLPFFFINDDASMLGYYDFHEKTLAKLKAETGLTRADLPPVDHIDWGPSADGKVYMPRVDPGVVADDHPWLRYQRFHIGEYVRIQQAAMDSLQSAWPGCFVADCGLMSGALGMQRGYYSPAYMAPLNSNGFYHYPYWSYSYPFQFAAARMGNRGKAPAIVTSLAYTAWGRSFQRDSLYRILVEAPQVIGMYSLDDLRESLADLEAECFETIRDIAGKASHVAPLLLESRVERGQGAIFLGLPQLCFDAHDRYMECSAMKSAMENFLRAGARLDLLCSEELLAGEASRYRVVFLNGLKWATQGEKRALEDFVRGGGVVVADSNTGIPIEGAQAADGPFGTGPADTASADCVARCRAWAQRLLPPRVASPASPDTGVFANRVGSLHLVWVMDLETEEELRAMAKAMDTDWERGVPNYLREREVSRALTRKVFRIEEEYLAYDLWTGKEVPLAKSDPGWREGAIEARLYEAHPLALLRDRIADLRRSAGPKKLARGDLGQFAFTLTGDRGQAVRGLVPAEVRVYGPDGQEAWEYGSQTLFRDGLLCVPLQVARNDTPGDWRLVVTELCSGRTADARVSVAE
jgi:hypothetical protein